MEWITTEKAAMRLAVSGSRIRAMVASGLLVGEKRGRDLAISAESVALQKATHGQVSRAFRNRIFLRDNLTCQSCGLVSEDAAELHLHHKIPRAQNGTNDPENLTTLCCDCHKDVHCHVSEKRQVNIRLRLYIKAALEDLANQWSCSETAACERAILEAYGRVSGATIRETEEGPTEPKAPPRRAETVAQRKAREAKEHAEKLAESDVLAKMTDRDDIEYDLENVPHRSVLHIAAQSVADKPKANYKVLERDAKPLNRPHGSTEAKRRREQ